MSFTKNNNNIDDNINDNSLDEIEADNKTKENLWKNNDANLLMTTDDDTLLPRVLQNKYQSQNGSM